MSRTKLSTTVSPETYQFLEQMISKGQATTMAEALDAVIVRVKRLENRKRLASATARYFEQLDSHTADEESQIVIDLASAAGKVDFDNEI